MNELFITENKDLYGKTEILLKQRTAMSLKILRNPNGKPYLAGNPLYFSLSRSGNAAVIAISENLCGVDLELIRGKQHDAVLKRFSDEERGEIENERDFLKHWTVRESYIKMHGLSLAAKLKDLKYVGGILYDRGQKADCRIYSYDGADYVISLCVQSEDETPPVIKNI